MGLLKLEGTSGDVFIESRNIGFIKATDAKITIMMVGMEMPKAQLVVNNTVGARLALGMEFSFKVLLPTAEEVEQNAGKLDVVANIQEGLLEKQKEKDRLEKLLAETEVKDVATATVNKGDDLGLDDLK